MTNLPRTGLWAGGLVLAAVLLGGCATEPKRMTPSAPAGTGVVQGGILQGMEVVEQPALEADWSDFVKDHYPNWRTHYWVDRGQWGNRGYIVGKAPTPAVEAVTTEITPLPPAPLATPPSPPPTIVENRPPTIEVPLRPTTYTVKKGDSLWRIAGKVYHNPLKWPRIYRANKEKIKHPNRIYPGQVLKIPQD